MTGRWSDRFDLVLEGRMGRLRLVAPVPSRLGWLERFELAFPLRVPERLDEGPETLRHVRGELHVAEMSLADETWRSQLARHGLRWGPEGEGTVRLRLEREDGEDAWAARLAVDGADLLLGEPVFEGGGHPRDALGRLARTLGRLGGVWEPGWGCWRWEDAARRWLREALSELGMRLPRQVAFAATPRFEAGRVRIVFAASGEEAPAHWTRLAPVYDALWRGEPDRALAHLERLPDGGTLDVASLRAMLSRVVPASSVPPRRSE